MTDEQYVRVVTKEQSELLKAALVRSSELVDEGELLYLNERLDAAIKQCSETTEGYKR